MLDSIVPSSNLKLSICISTYNRSEFVGITLRSIVPQLTNECEVLIVDNASTDSTGYVVSEYLTHYKGVRYIRMETNSGMDKNFDRAVEFCAGEYCWLMSDDDMLRPGAVAAVLQALRQEPSVVFVNAEFRDVTMTRLLQARFLNIDYDRLYGPWEFDRLFLELGDFVRYIGALVIKRALWLARNRNLYIGSFFNFVGMVFQERLPQPAFVLAEPYISYRSGNAQSFAPQAIEILLAKWPSLVESLPLSPSVKNSLPSARPWRHIEQLLLLRATGFYSFSTYRRWIRPRLHLQRERLLPVLLAMVPGVLANAICLLYLSTRRPDQLRNMQGLYLDALKLSPLNLSGRIRLPKSTKRDLNEPAGKQRT